MFDDEEEPKDWEIEEENPPEQLKRKWIVENLQPQAPITCPACKESLPYDSLSCLFCGASVQSTGSYLFQKFFGWIRKIFPRGK